MLANGAGAVQHSGMESGQESVDGILAHCPISSAQSSNDAAGPSTDAASNALPACWESGSMQAAGVPRFLNASSQDAPEHPPDEPSHLCGQAADSHESMCSDGGVSPDLSMDDTDDDSKPEEEEIIVSACLGDLMPDEWEGKIIGEEADGYLVVWESSFIPKECAGEAMIRAWEENKAKIMAGGGKRGRGTGLKQPSTIRGRVEKRGRSGQRV